MYLGYPPAGSTRHSVEPGRLAQPTACRARPPPDPTLYHPTLYHPTLYQARTLSVLFEDAMAKEELGA